ncbi:MAG TPA: S-methyl-5-thioribose-1-phosphate isomerase [Spirochaetia bacterium]|nr:S-methyl-5-thioribose-1-phosphate isomerase [Spirochaetia bacterium]
MLIDGIHYRTIWIKEDDKTTVQIIDQRKLPHSFEIVDLKTVDDFARAIRDMYVRGAGLIGAAAGFGLYVAALNARSDTMDRDIERAAATLLATRPTAKNLEWAVRRQLDAISGCRSIREKIDKAFETAVQIAEEGVEDGKSIGRHGARLIEKISREKGGETVHILTHCNAGWLAFVDYGSALAPVYTAHDQGISIHVWVDETRPRNQGARLTAWELEKHGVPCDLIVDNAGGHLMQHGMVDMVIVGSDRTTATGDVANKIGTYLKALASRDNGIPFYVALPSSTFDWDLTDGISQIPIEERDPSEVRLMEGLTDKGVQEVLICPPGTKARNFAFDVTPARLVTGLITERGICRADRESILSLFPERRA